MLAAAFLPIIMFGLLALVPTVSDTSSEDEAIDDPLEPTDPVDPVDPEDPIDPTDPVDPTDPEDPTDPVDPTTLGATFAADDTGVTIEFGENETGTLAIFTYVDTEDDADGFLSVHEARYYLVPEGTVWPDNTSETQINVPVPADYVAPDGIYELEDFEAAYGLELLGTVDLLAAGNDEPTNTNMADALPELTANRDAEYYYLEANTDGDDLIAFLQEGFLVTQNGVTETVVTGNAVGSDTIEWLSTETESVTLDGAGGDDILDANALNVALIGGDGDDALTALLGGATIEGGAGDDDIFAADANVSGGEDSDRINISGTGDSTASGDAGDDFLTTVSEGTSVLYGGAGNDNLGAGLAGSDPIDATLFGNEGDDFLAIGAGAVGSGGAGDDLLQVDAGGTAFGDAGSDLIRMSDFYASDSGTMIATGGDGGDIFEVSPRNVVGDAGSEIFAQIEDFNPDEDLLRVLASSPNDEVVGINIVEDPTGEFTDVNVDFRNQLDEIETVTVRLTGATGITANDVMTQ